MLLSATYHINVSTSPCMEDPSPQTILKYLHDLGFGRNDLRFNDEFYLRSWMQDEAFIDMVDNLRGAYLMWHTASDADATLTHLENARAMCIQGLSRNYLSKYNTVVSYFEALASRAGTPVHPQEQGARMQNLLLRMTACLH